MNFLSPPEIRIKLGRINGFRNTFAKKYFMPKEHFIYWSIYLEKIEQPGSLNTIISFTHNYKKLVLQNLSE